MGIQAKQPPSPAQSRACPDQGYLSPLLQKRVAGVARQRKPSCTVLGFFLQEEKVILIKHFISVAHWLGFSQPEAGKQQVPLSKRIINRQILQTVGAQGRKVQVGLGGGQLCAGVVHMLWPSAQLSVVEELIYILVLVIPQPFTR